MTRVCIARHVESVRMLGLLTPETAGEEWDTIAVLPTTTHKVAKDRVTYLLQGSHQKDVRQRTEVAA